jgi:hypothetical protein
MSKSIKKQRWKRKQRKKGKNFDSTRVQEAGLGVETREEGGGGTAFD